MGDNLIENYLGDDHGGPGSPRGGQKNTKLGAFQPWIGADD
jgi:hypothetical protein